jgi:para-nitrobenzyl esterase
MIKFILSASVLVSSTYTTDDQRVLYRNPTFQVSAKFNLTYAQGLACTDGNYPGTGCKPMDLLLNVYQPTAALNPATTSVPPLKPAYIIMHGGGNGSGNKEKQTFWNGALASAGRFWASRGMVVFNIDYRLAHDHGLLPKSATSNSSDFGWAPNWKSTYPAVRDLKAAVRYIKAHAVEYGVDPTLVAVSGGSAGATNSVAAGATLEDDYTRELTVKEDPTLNSTNLEQNATVKCVVAHWSTGQEVSMAQDNDPQNRTRWSIHNAPIIEFHGDVDTTIEISEAYKVKAEYARTGVTYELHVLESCGHAAWCYDKEKGNCHCHGNATYDSEMDVIALPFVAKELGVQLK